MTALWEGPWRLCPGARIFSRWPCTGLLQNWKKQHFICSNLTLFIVPFFLFSLFSLFFLFFLFFLSFFFFSFCLGGRPPAPSQMTPLSPFLVKTFQNALLLHLSLHAALQLDMLLPKLWRLAICAFILIFTISHIYVNRDWPKPRSAWPRNTKIFQQFPIQNFTTETRTASMNVWLDHSVFNQLLLIFY